MSAIILKDGRYWEADPEDIIQWQRAYTDIDCFAEINAAACWCEANPSKRKTQRGVKKFLNSWLKRAQDSGGRSPFAKVRADVIATRDMTMADMMSRDWAQ